MAVNRAVEAIMDAQIAMARAGYQMPEMTVSEACYWGALVAADPSVRQRRDGSTIRMVPIPAEGGTTGFQEIWTTPDQERGFIFNGPGGTVRVWRRCA